jgi:hypothetical protein
MMRNLFTGRRRVASLAAIAGMILASAAIQVTTADPAAALPGLVERSIVSPTTSDPATTMDVTCPSGLQVIGGGAAIGGYATTEVFLTQSFPLDQDTWHVHAAEIGQGWSGYWNLTAYAICASPLPGWEIQWGNSGGGSGTFKTTYTYPCSAGRKVISAGGRVNAPDGTVGLVMVRPDGPLTIGRASGRTQPDGYGYSWSVDSYAICAYPAPNQQNRGTITAGNTASQECPLGTADNGIGGGGGTVDLGPYYLTAIAPMAGRIGVDVRMTGNQQGGTMAQVTCSDI